MADLCMFCVSPTNITRYFLHSDLILSTGELTKVNEYVAGNVTTEGNH